MEINWQLILRRFLLVAAIALLCLVFLALGLMLGYGLIGDGDNPWAILSPAKWQELLNKFTGK